MGGGGRVAWEVEDVRVEAAGLKLLVVVVLVVTVVVFVGG